MIRPASTIGFHRRRATAIALAALTVPSLASAQALQCAAPSSLPMGRPDLPSDKEPTRIVPIGSYTLAITWTPHYCREHADDTSARFQCGSGNRFGFTLHGLWPDGIGKEWPQYCKSTALLPEPVIRGMLCSTPSAQLVQHEWAKHGTCMAGSSPAQYFARSSAMYAKLRFADMDALSRQPLTAGKFADAMAAANPGLRADMMRVTADRRGWLDEVWICLDKRFAYTRCAPHSGGLEANATVKIWRGEG